MIYEVYLNDQLLFYPNDDDFALANTELNISLNEAGTFECDVPASNPRYKDFSIRQSMIQVLKDGKEIFYGEVREVTQNFDFTKHIYAVGELAFLFDSIQPQYKYQTTPEHAFSEMLRMHNEQVEPRKRFTLGNVTVIDPNDYMYFFTNYDDTLTAIREKLCNKLNGYLRIRKVNGTRYLDLIPLEQYGQYCKQEIQFGENLLDYSCNFTASDIATAVIPLGAKLEEDERTYQWAVDGLDEYLSIRGQPIDQYHKLVLDDFISLPVAVARYGYIKVVKHWDDVTLASNLIQKAEDWLMSAQYSAMQLEVSAVDLNMLDSSIDSFEVGDTVHVWAEPYGMDTTFPVQKKTININDLSQNTIVLSNTQVNKSYTLQASNAVSELADEIPQASPWLVEAKNRALAMLLDETQDGNVVFEYDSSNSYIVAISICNAATIEASTKRWKWSQNAFGYFKRDNINQPWTDVGVAMTMNGEIVADFITAGSIKSDVLKTNVITAINDSEDTVKINASKVEVNGDLVAKSNLTDGVTQISGSNITTGTIDANNVNVKNVVAASVAAEDISGSKISGKELDGCTLRTATNDDYVEVKEGDIFGGSERGQHGYLTFSTLDSGNYKGVTLVGNSLVSILAGPGGNVGGISIRAYDSRMNITVPNSGTLFLNCGALAINNSTGVTKIFSIPNVYVDGQVREAVGFSFTNGILTNITY